MATMCDAPTRLWDVLEMSAEDFRAALEKDPTESVNESSKNHFGDPHGSMMFVKHGEER